MVSQRQQQQQQQQQPPERRTATSHSNISIMRFERSSSSSDSCAASNGRLFFLLLAIMACIVNIAMGPQAFVDIPSASIGYNNGRHLMQLDDKDESVSRRKRRALLYQHQPAQPKSNHDKDLARLECGHHSKSYSTFFQQPNEVRSSSNEDKTIYSIFFEGLHPEEMKNMTYVELGAFNGMEESNSRFFDVCLGWKGLLIEANPTAFSQLVVNRPHADCMSFAPSCSIEEEAANKTIGFLSAPRAWTNAAQVDTANAAAYSELEPIQVPCGSLTPVLRDLLPNVTFFSLDVEGAEALIVQNIDFDKVFIEIMIAENVNAHCKRNEPCKSRELTRQRMKDAGYHMFVNVVRRSDLYVHPQSRFLPMAKEAELGIKASAVTKAKASAVSTETKQAPSLSTTRVTHRISGDVLRTSSHYKHELYQYEPAATRTAHDIQLAREECGSHSDSYATFFQQSSDVRSSSNEDKTIFSTFFQSRASQDMKDMTYTYVELGGFDGKKESNSRFFDVCLQWKGLLIEANPSAYPDLIMNRPHADRLSFAPSCSAKEEAANKTIGFLSTPKAWTNAAQADTANAESYSDINPIQVPCGSLTPVLVDYFPGGNVTFFSLDVEGAEAQVVQNIDFSQVFIEFLIAENQNHHCPISLPCESRRLTRERMKQVGYTLFENVVRRSDLYIHPKSRFLETMMLAQQQHRPTAQIQ